MRVVSKFGEMWARNPGNIGHIPRSKEDGGKGVYVLYDGSMPVYVGKGNLHSRIYGARVSRRRGQLWDHFSWYALADRKMMHDIEALVLRMLPPYLRSLTRQKGNLEKALKIKQPKSNSVAEFISRRSPKIRG